MAKSFFWLEETKECINKFSIGYMINPKFNINKSFREQMDKYMNTTFGPITQPCIRATLAKNKSVSIINVLWDKKNPKKAFKVLSFVV